LYVPGNDEGKMKKIPSLNVDCVILDCEDGVALNRKVCIIMHICANFLEILNRCVCVCVCVCVCDNTFIRYPCIALFITIGT